jgi:hypothetical protein
VRGTSALKLEGGYHVPSPLLVYKLFLIFSPLANMPTRMHAIGVQVPLCFFFFVFLFFFFFNIYICVWGWTPQLHKGREKEEQKQKTLL